MVPSSDLVLSSPPAVLSDRGILLFQQRYIFADTRTVITLPTLQKASGAIFTEAELLEEWNETLVGAVAEEGLMDALEREAIEFDELLKTLQGDKTLRSMLDDEHLRSAVRKAVRIEIKRRKRNHEDATLS